MESNGRSIWVVSLISLPLLGALVGSSMMVDWSEASWRWRNVAWIAMGAGVPFVAALAHTRQIGILVVTLLVGATTYPAIRNLAHGETVADTRIRMETCDVRERHGTRCIEHRIALADGREVVAEHELVAPLGELRIGEEVRVASVSDVAVRIEKR